jgi:hypothetical protein
LWSVKKILEELVSKLPVAGEVVHEDGVDDITGLDDAGIREAVVDGGSFPAGIDDTAVAEDGEVAGDDGLGGGEGGDEIADGAFAVAKLGNDHEALGISEGLAEFGFEAEELGSVFRRHGILHDIEIYAYPYIILFPGGVFCQPPWGTFSGQGGYFSMAGLHGSEEGVFPRGM